MAQRKLQQEVDKCFKKVVEGVGEFEGIYEKIEQSTNTAQKEKLEDNLKREIKKLQRLRDQIKTWAASNDIKDKGPLLEHRRLIETQMEKFKAVEKAMKTKAYSKEGLSAATKLDPKEQAKAEASEFLGSVIDQLEQQIEGIEAEAVQIQASVKKGKVRGAQAERIAQIEQIIERHKFHQGKLELIRRSLENGGVEAEQVSDLKENINYYVTNGTDDDYEQDDETLYEDLNLGEEEDAFGMNQDGEKGSSQDTLSVQEDPSEDSRPTGVTAVPGGPGPAGKARTATEGVIAAGRRPSTQLKSPLPTLATLHTPLPTISNGQSSSAGMKPASVPTRPAGEGLKYASAAAAAAASDRSGVGIAPLPPPPGMPPVSTSVTQQAQASRPSAANSPSIASVLPSSSATPPQPQSTAAPPPGMAPAAPSAPTTTKSDRGASSRTAGKSQAAAAPAAAAAEPAEASKGKQGRANGVANGAKSNKGKQVQQQQQQEKQQQQHQKQSQAQHAPSLTLAEDDPPEEESIYHLPASLNDLVESYEATKKKPLSSHSQATQRALTVSCSTQPVRADLESPVDMYQPDMRCLPSSSSHYPREPLEIFSDPRLYNRLDTDTLFYIFYYKQGTYQQFLAAKALKDQSWRFHKQYQTWFQRHEEPKNITEEFEQGTYRFFDYESTWMNRRKADFKFAYKYLEDDV